MRFFTTFPPPLTHIPTSLSLSLLPVWRGQGKTRGGGFAPSESNNRRSSWARLEKSRQRSPWDGRKWWGTPFSSVGSTPGFTSCQFTGISFGRWYIWLWRWQIRNGMEVESAFPLIFSWRVLEAISNWCWWWRRRRCPSARPVRRKRRPGSTPGTIYSTPGRQLGGGWQGPRRAAISAYWRGWWERAWDKKKDNI